MTPAWAQRQEAILHDCIVSALHQEHGAEHRYHEQNAKQGVQRDGALAPFTGLRQFLFDLAIAQYRGPAARARVAAAGPVGEDLDIGQLRHRARNLRYW